MTERPIRIRLSRAKGWRMPAGTVKVDRSTDWGNPYLPAPAALGGAGRAVELFREYCPPDSLLAEAARRILRGKNLACWCALPAPGEPDICHAAVLLELANK